MLDDVDLSLKPRKMMGRFFDNPSIYMQDPSPEVDEAWDIFSKTIFTASSSTLKKVGVDLETAVQAPSFWEQGDDAYLVQYDVFHQYCSSRLEFLSLVWSQGGTEPHS